MRFFLVLCTFFFFTASAFAAPPAKEFGTLPKIYDATISPDGSKIAAYVNVKGGYGLAIFYIDGSGREPLAAGMEEGVKPSWIKWANNDVVLASIWQSQKYGTTPINIGYIYTLDITTKKGKYLIVPNKGKALGSKLGSTSFFRQFNNDVIDHLASDPDHILMSFSDENVFAPDVQKVNVRTGSYKRIKRGQERIQDWYTDLRGELRVAQGLRDQSKENWLLQIRDRDNDKWRSYKEFPGLKANTSVYGFTSNPDEMIIGQYAGRDTLGLYIYDLAKKRLGRKLFHHEDYDAGNLIYNADGTEIVGASYVSDSKEIELFGSSKSTLQSLRQKHPELTIDYIDSTADFSKVLVKISNPSDPGEIYVLDTQTNDMQLISSLYKGIHADDLGLVISVKYSSRDGQKIPAYVTLPPTVNTTAAIKNLPFIVLPHGGPYARDSKRFDYLAQFFATRGYGVLQMNFRGSTGYGKKFSDAGRKKWVVMQEDVEDGTRWLFEKGYADPAKTCIAGWSYGGYAALMGSIKNPDLYACTVSMAGVTDLKGLMNDMKDYRFGRLQAKKFLGGFDGKEDLSANSPVERAGEMTKPLFIAHGTLDSSVQFSQYKRMKSALKKSSAKVTAIEFKDEDHYLSNEKNRIEFFEELESFLESSVGKSEYMK